MVYDRWQTALVYYRWQTAFQKPLSFYSGDLKINISAKILNQFFDQTHNFLYTTYMWEIKREGFIATKHFPYSMISRTIHFFNLSPEKCKIEILLYIETFWDYYSRYKFYPLCNRMFYSDFSNSMSLWVLVEKKKHCWLLKEVEQEHL